jgi:hypothetical protein
MVLNDIKLHKDWPDFTKSVSASVIGSSEEYGVHFLLSTWGNCVEFQRAISSSLSSLFSNYLTYIYSHSYLSLLSSLFTSIKLLFMLNMVQYLTYSCHKCENCYRMQRCNRHAELDDILFARPMPFRISNRNLQFRILRTRSVSTSCSLQLHI